MKRIKTFTLVLLGLQLLNTKVFAESCSTINLNDSRFNVGRCSDGTISFHQPSTYKGSERKGSYEGLCGAVASANVFHAYCDETFLIPAEIGPKYFYDITPGIRPDTLVSGLNELFNKHRSKCVSGNWNHYYATNRWDFINRLDRAIGQGRSNWMRRPYPNRRPYKVSPVIVLISKNNADTLHYVTVTDVRYDKNYDFNESEHQNKCKVYYNDYKKSRSTTCKNFASWARQVDNSTFTSWMKEYNYFKYVQ